MIPKVLLDVEEYLRKANLVLPSGGPDKRFDSAQAERDVVQVIQNANRWEVYSPDVGQTTNRAWYDVRVEGFYLNVKISECKTNDNANAKMAIFYLLTGEDPDTTTSVQAEKYFKDMKKLEDPDEERDYYYLIVNKQDPTDVFIVSLKGISHCRSSSNNPPFQANWGKCREPKERSWAEARKLFLGLWRESIVKSIVTNLGGMPAAYPELFGEEHISALWPPDGE